jgi:hypothetical protein
MINWNKIKYKITYSKPYITLYKFFKPNSFTTYRLTPLTEDDVIAEADVDVYELLLDKQDK